MDSPAQRRIQAIQQHLISSQDEDYQASSLRPNETAGEFVLGTLSLPPPLSLPLSLSPPLSPTYIILLCVFVVLNSYLFYIDVELGINPEAIARSVV